jgi:uncharacterized protein (TIGR03067 family)
MDRGTKTALTLAVWTIPVLVGMAIATGVLLTAPRPVPRPAGAPPQEDRDRLQGTWEGIRLERDGKVVYEGAAAGLATVRFVGDSVTFEDRGTRLEGSYRVDPDRVPKTFDLIVADGDALVTYPAGIYQLYDDIFRLCFAFPSGERPKTFATGPGSGRTLFVYRRARPFPRDSTPRGPDEPHPASDPKASGHLEAEDSTFPEPGMIGLWSKADAQSYFDDLTVSE